MALPKSKDTTGSVKPVNRSAAVKNVSPCSLSHEPNEETKHAIREARQGVGVTTYKSVGDMWEALVK